jgi:GT2 family glycosyltransferase
MMDIVCDLVLLSWNHLEETQPCLESLFETTRLPVRLLIVDNGSTSAVRAFLAAVRPRGAIQEVVLLQNEANEGFPRGMNRGIKASKAPFVCLLNNDLRFSTGWLEGMIEVAQANPTVGVVNPESNTFGHYPPAGVSLQEYADRLRTRQGHYTEVGMCIGFCVLLKREVLDRIGGLSEEVERIFFEDEDFCMRAQQAGYQCVVAAGSYVYHAEHQTVRKMPEREALFARNQRWCEERWGKRLRVAWARWEPVVPGSLELRQWLMRFVDWARRRTHVYVYCPTPSQVTVDVLFRSVGLVPHADIHWYPIPMPIAKWVAAGLILKRRKKRFDIIVAPDTRWGRWMSRLRWLHGASVVCGGDEGNPLALWEHPARPSLLAEGPTRLG